MRRRILGTRVLPWSAWPQACSPARAAASTSSQGVYGEQVPLGTSHIQAASHIRQQRAAATPAPQGDSKHEPASVARKHSHWSELGSAELHSVLSMLAEASTIQGIVGHWIAYASQYKGLAALAAACRIAQLDVQGRAASAASPILRSAQALLPPALHHCGLPELAMVPLLCALYQADLSDKLRAKLAQHATARVSGAIATHGSAAHARSLPRPLPGAKLARGVPTAAQAWLTEAARELAGGPRLPWPTFRAAAGVDLRGPDGTQPALAGRHDAHARVPGAWLAAPAAAACVHEAAGLPVPAAADAAPFPCAESALAAAQALWNMAWGMARAQVPACSAVLSAALAGALAARQALAGSAAMTAGAARAAARAAWACAVVAAPDMPGQDARARRNAVLALVGTLAPHLALLTFQEASILAWAAQRVAPHDTVYLQAAVLASRTLHDHGAALPASTQQVLIALHAAAGRTAAAAQHAAQSEQPCPVAAPHLAGSILLSNEGAVHALRPAPLPEALAQLARRAAMADARGPAASQAPDADVRALRRACRAAGLRAVCGQPVLLPDGSSTARVPVQLPELQVALVPQRTMGSAQPSAFQDSMAVEGTEALSSSDEQALHDAGWAVLHVGMQRWLSTDATARVRSLQARIRAASAGMPRGPPRGPAARPMPAAHPSVRA